ncbi:MAG: hypothetical protein PHP42_00770 [Bacteroidota bacterium]|nr:hypothetical protein [Bacteroidota bacterium]
MKNLTGLFNTWSGLAVVFGIFASITHGVFFYVFIFLAGLFALIALHFEFIEQFGKRFKYVSAILGIVMFSSFVYDNYQKNETQTAQITYLTDSIRNLHDTINHYKYLFAVAETSKTNAIQKSELVQKYMSVTNEPSIRISSVTPIFQINKPATIMIEFENNGGSSAKPLIVFSSCIADTISTKRTEFTLFNETKQVYPDFVKGEQRSIIFTVFNNLTGDTLRKINNDSILIYAYGRFSFPDLSSKMKTIDFCFFYDNNVKSMQDIFPRKFIYEKTNHKKN